MGACLILTVQILYKKTFFIRHFICMLIPKLLHKEQKQFHHFKIVVCFLNNFLHDMFIVAMFVNYVKQLLHITFWEERKKKSIYENPLQCCHDKVSCVWFLVEDSFFNWVCVGWIYSLYMRPVSLQQNKLQLNAWHRIKQFKSAIK